MSTSELCFHHLSSSVGGPARKTCGHSCVLDTEACCECSDIRPHDQKLYLRYIDGAGGLTLPIGARADGYCMLCKPRCFVSNVTVRTPTYSRTDAPGAPLPMSGDADAARPNLLQQGDAEDHEPANRTVMTLTYGDLQLRLVI